MADEFRRLHSANRAQRGAPGAEKIDMLMEFLNLDPKRNNFERGRMAWRGMAPDDKRQTRSAGFNGDRMLF